jgi:hypothetical protein
MVFGASASASAGAATLGISTPPTSAPGMICLGALMLGQSSADASTPYAAPSEGGRITQWQTYTAGDIPGSQLELYVLRPEGNNYAVVATDTETLPNPLPANSIATFTPVNPIALEGGDTLGLNSVSPDECAFPTLPPASVNDGMFFGLPTAVGNTVSPNPLGTGWALDVAATLSLPADLGITTATPSADLAGGDAVLGSAITNAGPGSSAVTTFVDHVPKGLQVLGAASGIGSCSVSGQTVTCTLPGLAAGQSTTAQVVVATPTAGSYANVVDVSGGSDTFDLNSANNEASAALVVTTPPSTASSGTGSSSTGSSGTGSSSTGSSGTGSSSTGSSNTGSPTITPQSTVTQHCLVPSLRKTPMAVARTVLTELGCTVKVTRQHASVGKGLVIATKGKAGSYPLKQRITLIVSSGPKAKKHKKR